MTNLVLHDEKCHDLIEALRAGNLTYAKSKLAKHPDWRSFDLACKVSV